MIMETTSKPFSGYIDGAEMWRDNVLSYGRDEAVTICNNYLDMNLKCEHYDDERQFCKELFTAMFEATAGKTDTTKLVYPYDFEEADKRTETSYYHESRERNAECARGIDSIINASCYETNFYNLEIAAMKAIVTYGFARVNLVLAFNIQQHKYDGRYSSANKRWADTFSAPEKAFNGRYLNAHACLVDSFATYIRELYAELGAERFALPGREEHNAEPVHGYEILRSIMVDGEQGYVIAHNSNACDPYVSWQFRIRDGERHYNWGVYGSEQHAVDAYIARVIIHDNNERNE